jgi:hypothetical protein
MKCLNCSNEAVEDGSLCETCNDTLNYWIDWSHDFRKELEDGIKVSKLCKHERPLTETLVRYYRS